MAEDNDPRHVDRAAEEAKQQAVKDAVAALDLSQVGREPAAREEKSAREHAVRKAAK